MPSESLDCPSIAARMRLEWSWNVPTRMQERPECTSNACRLLWESNSIFSVLKESNWNALRMPSESLDCPSIAARMRLEWSWNVPTRMQECPECTSNAVGIFRLPLECGSNAVRMHLECPDQEKKRMTRIHLECISIAAEIYFDILGT